MQHSTMPSLTPGASCPAWHPTQDPQQALTLHIQARAARGARALSWSRSLASSAQTYANRCVFQVSMGVWLPAGWMAGIVVVGAC